MKKEKKKVTTQLKETQVESSKLRFENLKKYQSSESLELIHHDPCSLDKEFNEKKIIKEFQMKRKLLMKELKKKQKEKNPTLVTFESLQIKEGIIENNKINFESKSIGIESINEESISKSNSFNSVKSSKGIVVQKTVSRGKISVGIQTPDYMIKTKKIQKQKKNRSHEESNLVKAKITLDRIKKKDGRIMKSKVKGYKMSEIQNEQKKSKLKNARKDINEIKKQVANLFIKKKPQSSSLSQISNQSILSFSSNSGSSHQSQRLQICSIIHQLNKDIETYYKQKSLKKVILNQVKNKFNKKKRNLESRQEQSNLLGKQLHKSSIKATDNAKNNQSNEEKTKKIKKKQKSSNNNRESRNYNRKLINERFKMALIEDSSFKQNITRFKQNETQKVLDQYIQKEKSKSYEKDQELEDSFDISHNWKMQFKQISQMLLRKFVYLKAYVSDKKRIDYQNIYKKIRKEAKEDINSPGQKRRGTRRSNSLNQQFEYPIGEEAFFYKNKLDFKKQYPTNKNNRKKQNTNGFKRFKQIKIGKEELDQFGKSFQNRKLLEQNDEGQFTFEEFHRQININHGLNYPKELLDQSQFVIKSLSSKSNSIQKHQSSSSQFIKSDYSSVNGKMNDLSVNQELIGPKILIHPIEEWSLFRGQKGKEYLYMSEEIQQ